MCKSSTPIASPRILWRNEADRLRACGVGMDSLESALVNYTALTKGDTIEIYYNMIKFEFLIQEIVPPGPAICVIDTDLEVSSLSQHGRTSSRARLR